MKSVCLTRVSIGVIAAWMAGCGGGSGGADNLAGTTPPPFVIPTSKFAVVEPEQLTLFKIKHDEFKQPTLLSYSNADLFLVWDDRYAGSGIRAMFYHPSTGWGEIQQVAAQTLPGIDGRYSEFSTRIDDQGNAIVMSKENYVFNNVTHEWVKFVLPPEPTNPASFFGRSMVMDNSTKSVAMIIDYVALAKSTDNLYYTDVGIKITRLKEDGSWVEEPTISVIVLDDQPLACIVSYDYCISDMSVDADENGRLFVMYNVKNNGKRISTWSEETGWRTPYFVDRALNVSGGSLNISRNGTGVAIWPITERTDVSITHNLAWFDGTRWSTPEPFQNHKVAIDRINVGENGAMQIVGHKYVSGLTQTEVRVGMRRESASAPWSEVELMPDGVPSDQLNPPINGRTSRAPFWPLTSRGLLGVFTNVYSDPYLKTKIREIHYSAAGWSQVTEMAKVNNSPSLLFAPSANDVVGIKWEYVDNFSGAGAKSNVTTFRLSMN